MSKLSRVTIKTFPIYKQLPCVLTIMYLDTYSLERVSIATGSLDSTTSRSNLQSVWHCVSDSFRCFEGQKEVGKEMEMLKI